MNISELLEEATRKRKAEDIFGALVLYEQIWEQEKNGWNGYYLTLCYRKTENYFQARKIHEYLENYFPGFTQIKSEKLWLEYSEKIKNWKNPDLVSDAEKIISQTGQNDMYTGRVYVKTILRVTRYLRRNEEYTRAFFWLKKLDHSGLSNNPYPVKGQMYSSDKKTFFHHYAFFLVQLDQAAEYIRNCLRKLNCEGGKLESFYKAIIQSITFNEKIFPTRLTKYVKSFEEEIYLRKEQKFKTSYSPEKTTLISDLSHFIFCPVSFAIAETFEIDPPTPLEIEDWIGDKKKLIDRFLAFQKSNNYEEAFSGTGILVNAQVEKDFAPVFDSKVVTCNVPRKDPKIFFNSDNTLIGVPDYIFEDRNGSKFAVTEKFTGVGSADHKDRSPYDSDLIKHYAYIRELNLNLTNGIFITWYWDLVEHGVESGIIKKEIVIQDYRLTKVELSPEDIKLLEKTIASIRQFKASGQMQIDGDRIFHPQKCLKCSVVKYCNHKTGKFDLIELPYTISEVSVEDIEDKGQKNGSAMPGEEDTIDFPF